MNKNIKYNFILGDCIEKLKELDDQSIDIIVIFFIYKFICFNFII